MSNVAKRINIVSIKMFIEFEIPQTVASRATIGGIHYKENSKYKGRKSYLLIKEEADMESTIPYQ